ncbi:MAG: vWA domain-containing protein [Gaiellaceae bacterium]
MHVAFLTPLAALAVLLAGIPLGAWFFLVRRDSRARRALSLPRPMRASRLGPALAIAGTAALIGVAAAQPVIQRQTAHRERTDAEAYVVFDISRSMAASPGPNAPDRMERARKFALALRPRLAAIPIGVASFTDRVLPHLFPTPDESAFAGVTRRAIGVEQPPPQRFYANRATALNSLESFVTAAFFRPETRYRAVIVLTDGESQPVSAGLAATLRKPPGVHVVFVHVWRSDDRIYPTSVADPNYHPDPNSGAVLARAAATLGGKVVSENDVGAAAAATREALGSGPIRKVSETARVALMPWVTLAAFLPLGFVLWRRNF